MPSYDFAVDLTSLARAAQAAMKAVETFHDKDMSDLVPRNEDLGHGDLWSAVDEFQDRWDRGASDMCDDIEEMAGRLTKVVETYARFDEESTQKMTALKAQAGGLMHVPGMRR